MSIGFPVAVLPSKPLATSGVDTITAVKDGAIVRTPQICVTPEMYGAVGDGVTNDLTALQNGIAAAREAGIPFIGRGFYFINAPLTIDSSNGGTQYWDGSTTDRPSDIYIRELKTSSIDAAIKITGSLVSDRVHVGHLIGPGTGTTGTPGGTDERIGILIEDEISLKIDSVSDFNFGVVLQNCFTSDIEIGFAFACKKGLYARLRPSDSVTNQRCNIRARKAGGPFTSSAFPNDTLRRSRSCDVGIHLESMSGAVLDLGSPEYCQLTSASKGVQMDTGATKNTVYVYCEGARDDGEFLSCAGFNNQIHFSGLGSPDIVKIGAIRITGLGNHIYGLGDILSAASKAAIAPESSAGIIRVMPGNTVHGRYKEMVYTAPSILRLNLLTDATSFTASSGVSATTQTDVPAGYDFKESYELTLSDSSTQWYTSGNITVTSETLDVIKVVTAAKGITNHSKVGFYILNGSGAVIGEQQATALEGNSEWKVIETLLRIGNGLGNIQFRFSIRNPVGGETGAVLRVARPLLTYNLDHPLVRTNDVMPSGRGIWGDHIPKNIYNYQGFSYKPQIVTDITATTFEVNSRACAICTAHPTGSSVNLINNLIEDQPTMIINASGSSITFTTSAGAWTSSIVLADGDAMTVLKTTGSGTFSSDVWRVG